jgi:hypothetical protein
MVLRPKKSAGRAETFKTEWEVSFVSQKFMRVRTSQQNLKDKIQVQEEINKILKIFIMARTREPTVDDCERINVIESTTVDFTTQDNPTLKIQIPKLEDVSFNFEFESEVIIQESCLSNTGALSIWN